MGSNWFIALKVAAGPWWSRVAAPPPGVRLFAADDLHLTVAFLGPVSQGEAEAAFARAPSWPCGAVDATLGRVVAMGSARRPSALSAGVERGREELVRGTLAVRAAMVASAGGRPDDRPPRPHVTVARPRRRAGREERERALAWAAGIDLGSPLVRLDRLVLYTRAGPGGARLFREHAAFDVGAAREPGPGS